MTRLRTSISNSRWDGLEKVWEYIFFNSQTKEKHYEEKILNFEKLLETGGKFQFVPKTVFDEAEKFAKVIFSF